MISSNFLRSSSCTAADGSIFVRSIVGAQNDILTLIFTFSGILKVLKVLQAVKILNEETLKIKLERIKDLVAYHGFPKKCC